MGHKVRNVINGRHRVTKQPLNLFYVDLEPTGKNKEIYTINWLPIYINHHVVPYENTAKYLGMTLDAKLRWKPHVKKKKRNNSN
jgi:hypothetical protein